LLVAEVYTIQVIQKHTTEKPSDGMIGDPSQELEEGLRRGEHYLKGIEKERRKEGQRSCG
jgi:hypothetical protein